MTSSSLPADQRQLALWEPDIPAFARWSVCVAGEDTGSLHPDEARLLHPDARPERQRAFRLGRRAAHDALASLGRDSGPILTGEMREPIWPPEVMGSISHTTDIGVALVALAEHTDGVGVDIERRRHAPELDTQVPRPEERAWLDRLEQSARPDALLSLFSAKESIFKAFFPAVRSYFGFSAAVLEPTASGYAGRLIEPVSSAYPPDRSFAVGCKWFGANVVTWLVLPVTGSSSD